MKIAVVSNGAASLLNFRGPLLETMLRQGHEVLALAPDYDDVSRRSIEELGATPVDFDLSRSSLNPLHDVSTLINLRRLFRFHQPTVVLSYFLKPVIYGTLAAWAAAVPRRYALIEGLGFAFTPTGKTDLKRLVVRTIVTRLLRLSLSKALKVIVLNPDDAFDLIEAKMVKHDQLEVLGGIGVDLDEWAFSMPPTQPVTFILVARLLWDKGILEYVQAAQIVKQTCPEVRFILVGGLDDNPSAVPRAEVERWLSDGILDAWPGHTAVRPWLQRASVFVLPSYREGVPRSTQEAMALGRPVITTDVPGCRETVIDSVNGFLVPRGDAFRLAEAMHRFLSDPALIIQTAAQSRKLAEERFDVKTQNGKLLAWMGL